MYGGKINFQQLDLLGSGAYGNVYKVILLESGCLAAMKQIHKRDISNTKEYQREIKALQRLQHPNIVQFIGTTSSEKYLRIFLEYVAGGSLRNLLNSTKRINEDLAGKYTKQIICGLTYLHENGCVHRDVKSDNILVSTNGTIKLADFGASALISNSSQTSSLNSLRGTALYIAPEIAKSQKYGKASDIWSLGCTVHEMLTGCPPLADRFQTANAIEIVLWKQKHDEEIVIPNVSASGQAFLKCCFQRNPKKRPKACELNEHPWIVDGPSCISSQLLLAFDSLENETEEKIRKKANKKQKNSKKRFCFLLFLILFFIGAVIAGIVYQLMKEDSGATAGKPPVVVDLTEKVREYLEQNTAVFVASDQDKQKEMLNIVEKKSPRIVEKIRKHVRCGRPDLKSDLYGTLDEEQVVSWYQFHIDIRQRNEIVLGIYDKNTFKRIPRDMAVRISDVFVCVFHNFAIHTGRKRRGQKRSNISSIPHNKLGMKWLKYTALQWTAQMKELESHDFRNQILKRESHILGYLEKAGSTHFFPANNFIEFISGSVRDAYEENRVTEKREITIAVGDTKTPVESHFDKAGFKYWKSAFTKFPSLWKDWFKSWKKTLLPTSKYHETSEEKKRFALSEFNLFKQNFKDQIEAHSGYLFNELMQAARDRTFSSKLHELLQENGIKTKQKHWTVAGLETSISGFRIISMWDGFLTEKIEKNSIISTSAIITYVILEREFRKKDTQTGMKDARNEKDQLKRFIFYEAISNAELIKDENLDDSIPFSKLTGDVDHDLVILACNSDGGDDTRKNSMIPERKPSMTKTSVTSADSSFRIPRTSSLLVLNRKTSQTVTHQDLADLYDRKFSVDSNFSFSRRGSVESDEDDNDSVIDRLFKRRNIDIEFRKQTDSEAKKYEEDWPSVDAQI